MVTALLFSNTQPAAVPAYPSLPNQAITTTITTASSASSLNLSAGSSAPAVNHGRSAIVPCKRPVKQLKLGFRQVLAKLPSERASTSLQQEGTIFTPIKPASKYIGQQDSKKLATQRDTKAKEAVKPLLFGKDKVCQVFFFPCLLEGYDGSATAIRKACRTFKTLVLPKLKMVNDRTPLCGR
ncbi:hypothetical protein JCM11641_003565 [Rhodosporidiobolus odoratus]